MKEEPQRERQQLGRHNDGREFRDRERRDVEDIEEDRDDLGGNREGWEQLGALRLLEEQLDERRVENAVDDRRCHRRKDAHGSLSDRWAVAGAPGCVGLGASLFSNPF